MALIPCPECGNMISDKAFNCPKCGYPINNSSKPTTSAKKKGSKTAIIVAAIVFFIAVLVAILVIFHNRHQRYDDYYYDYDEPVEEVVEEVYDGTEDDYPYDSDYSLKLSELESIIREYNEELPTYIDEGMDLEMVELDGDYVVYSYSLDEDYYDIDYYRTNRTEVKRILKNEVLNSDDKDVEIFINVCKACDKGIAYRFVGLISGDACTIYIEPSEL